ncbi:MAG: hypothetical protein ACAH17_01685 [Candidatus Paceibacterota bacterium]
MAETQDDIDYRMSEQRFVANLISDLHHRTGESEDYVKAFGYLVMGIVPHLAGLRPATEWKMDPFGLPIKDVHKEEVLPLWQYMMNCVQSFCTEEGKVELDAVQFNWVLKRIHEELMKSVYSSVVSERSRQNMWRI